MELFGIDVLDAFKRKHAGARIPLERWEETVREAQWSNFAELRATFANADQVKADRLLVTTVFNVGGNKYRLISEVLYIKRRVDVKMVLTHSEYGRGRWKGALRK